MRILTENAENMLVCNFCNCVYEYDNKDLMLVASNVVRVICPKCGQPTMLVFETKLKEVNIIEVTENDRDK